MRLLIRLLLALHPASFRRDRAEEVRSHVEEGARRARQEGWWEFVRFAARSSVDLLASAVRLRMRPVLPASGGSRGEGGPGVSLRADARYALRALCRTPALTLGIVMTLGMGVGMATALFSVVDAVLLQAAPFEHPERLAHVRSTLRAEEDPRTRFTGGQLDAMRSRLRSFEGLAGVTSVQVNLTGLGRPRLVRAGWASPDLFEVLGVDPVLGRGFEAGDPSGLVLLSHDFWAESLGSDPHVVGGALHLDGHPHRIVGVLPAGFRLSLPSVSSGEIVLWKNPDEFWQNGDVWGDGDPEGGMLELVGRLARGVTFADARRELHTYAAELRARDERYAGLGYALDVARLDEYARSRIRPELSVLAVAVILAFLVACGNVGSLLTLRALTRSRELRLRRALGASYRSLAGLLWMEALALTAAGSLVAVTVAGVGLPLLTTLAPGVPGLDGAPVSGRTLLFALGLSGLVTVMVGLAPILWLSRKRSSGWVLGASTEGRFRPSRVRRVVTVGQLTVSAILLVGAGLLARSALAVRSADPGYRVEDVVTFSLSLPSTRYDWPGETGDFFLELDRHLGALPGVASAGTGWPLPLSGGRWSAPYSGGEVAERRRHYAGIRVATPGYFETLDIELVEGRLFLADHDPGSVVVVSRSVAERAWPAGSAVGQTLKVAPWGGEARRFEVVGVVEDVRHGDIRGESAPLLYFDVRRWSWADWELHVAVYAPGGAEAILPALRGAVEQVDPGLAPARIATMRQRVDGQLQELRFVLTLVWIFSAVAWGLALYGLYVVVAHSVRARRLEMGVRLALGAGPASIVRRLFGEGVRLAAVGLALGLLAAYVMAGLLGTWLYRTSPHDPLTYVATLTTLMAGAVGVSWLSARRSLRYDPVDVLRWG